MGFGLKMNTGISEVCCLRVLMLKPKSDFYSVQRSRKRTRSVHLNGPVYDKTVSSNCPVKMALLMTEQLFRTSVSFFFLYFSFLKYIFPFMW